MQCGRVVWCLRLRCVCEALFCEACKNVSQVGCGLVYNENLKSMDHVGNSFIGCMNNLREGRKNVLVVLVAEGVHVCPRTEFAFKSKEATALSPPYGERSPNVCRIALKLERSNQPGTTKLKIGLHRAQPKVAHTRTPHPRRANVPGHIGAPRDVGAGV